MSNPMKYIKDLEAAGFQRNQAEAQVQMVLDAIEGNLVTKSDFAVFQERSENKYIQHEQRMASRFEQHEKGMDARIKQHEQRMDARFEQFEQKIERRLVETEFRLVSRIGLLVVSSTTIAVALLSWLNKT